MNIKARKQVAGFTIIEIAIVMIVAGSLLAFLGSALVDFQQKRRIEITEYRLEKIRQGISSYLSSRGRFPCPASRISFPGQATFGKEVNAIDCRGNIAGTRRITGFSGAVNALREGAVPVRDLNLEDELIVDGWGNAFSYVVTINQATIAPPIRYSANGGDIDIVGRDGVTSILATPGSAHYLVISHGADGQGARSIASNTISIPCENVAANIQRTNCVTMAAFADPIFMETTHMGAGFFDDFLAYEAASAANDDIPTGAVVPFALQNCPKGWSVLEQARGRFIMGAVDTSDSSIRRTELNGVSPGATVDRDYSVEQIGDTNNENAQFNVPPYIALLYCRKN